MKWRTNALCVAVTLTAASYTFAAEQEETMTVWSSPASTTTSILGRETIEKLDKKNIAEALAVIPGVTLQKHGARNELQIRVRGMDNRQVPVYLDGVPIYVPYDGNIDLGRIMTSDVSSVEVSKSYASLLQGPNQMGGAINITTSKPRKELEASVGYRQGWSRGSQNAYDTYASFSVSHDLGYILFSGSRFKQDYLGLPHDVNNDISGHNGQIANSATDDKRGTLKIGFTPRGSDEYSFTYTYQDGAKSDPPYTGKNSLQGARYWQWPEYDKKSFYYQGTTHMGDHFTLKSRYYHDTFNNTLLIYNSLSALKNKNGGYSRYADFSNGAGLQLSTDLRESDLLSFAVNWKDDIHRSTGTRNGSQDRYRDRTWSLASEYQWTATQALNVVGGISYDWRDSKQAMAHERNGSITHYPENSKHAVNKEVMAKYQLNDRHTLALALTDKTRFPTLKERYTTNKPAGHRVGLINPSLQPERARGIDVTLSGSPWRSWDYEISVYYNRISDAILTQSIDPGHDQNRNSGRIDFSGLDLGIKGDITDYLSVGISYGLIHASPKSKEIRHITGAPTQSVNGWLTITPIPKLRLTLSEEARTSSYSTTQYDFKAAGFAVTHLRADYDVGYGLSVNVSVNNLFDSRYAYSEGFIEEGRNFWLGMAYKF
ncbi:TonB-dependent receptor [Jejubacter calystegiae]|uniref:TonB-dependent receptor n=1 Tax=Jejubacter calystegiae TaxID=2579935 RepID=A0A4P8YF54_9ENTR|nr:TonB-dependent receptor [Jejubacter calystegiae]QCT19201.1 TonB-dependent receptor [Jejubacter calystegiae]